MSQSQLKDEKLIDKFVTLSADLITQVQSGHVSEEGASIRALIDTCDLALYMRLFARLNAVLLKS